MKLLHIDSSILGEASASRELGAAWVRNWRQRHPDAEVHHRDLAREPLAHLSGEIFAARTNPDTPRTPELQRDVDADRAALDEFLAADVVGIGAPMYNFSLPTQLKGWIDRIAVAGKTFRYTANGPEGLMGGKKVVVISSRGGIYSQGPMAALDHQESYLRGLFGFLGITDVEFLRAEGLSYGPEHRATAMSAAHRSIEAPLAIAA